jgi:hypothetical protein
MDHEPIRLIESLTSRAAADIGRVIEEAYRQGREDMKRELMAVLSPSAPRSANTTVSLGITKLAVVPQTGGKLPPGTVKPTILKLIMDTPGGLPTEEIIAKTGFKENSVRGTLSGLLKLGQVFRSGKNWVTNAEAPVKLSTEAPNSSDSGSSPLFRETADHDR